MVSFSSTGVDRLNTLLQTDGTSIHKNEMVKLATDYKITRLRCLAIVIVVFGHSIILYDLQ